MVPRGSPEVNARVPKQVQRRLRPTAIKDLVARYQAGDTVYQLATQFAIHRTTVSSLLERRRVPRRNGPLSPAQIDRAKELYVTGQSLANVARQIGCQANTVRLALVKAGVRTRHCHGRER